jgi:tyrosyl-tRNA synthetase
MGRELQKHFGQKPQIIMTLPLLPGLDGIKKMSKSLGNYIGIEESADQIFGKVMSISDETMWLWYELVSFKSLAEIQSLRDSVANGANPRDIKFMLAEEISARFHSVEGGRQAKENFIAQFQKGQLPEDMPEIKIETEGKGMQIAHLIKQGGLTESTSEAIRLIQQGGVKVDGEKIQDKNLLIEAKKTIILQVGKRRFAKIEIN